MYVPLIAKQAGILCPGHLPNNLYPDPCDDDDDKKTMTIIYTGSHQITHTYSYEPCGQVCRLNIGQVCRLL